ncbi:hypothetical protein [Arsenicibacter rosenii]|uniref:Glycosyltransferase RgtA/B/C/D-like domain-containing protein n=1 Tax=Arsenicibacter rosenii TaxID=1750698 RepID=A0A1S2VMG4_9BACT|nr:hypothetical protein [Arsenicibacter rosenii]OIN59386.1 hypothetical protein BLX24_10445 [Arsenicibacter rosenii]
MGLLLLVCLAIATYVFRNPSGDDAWFAEQSYWLNQTGIVRSNFFTGVLGWDTQLLVSHKLFLCVGAVLMSLFGNNLVAVQLSGLIFFLIMVAEIGSYVYKREQSWQSFYLLAILILIFSNRLLIRMSFENRPEMMLAALGFGSFLCLNGAQTKSLRTILAGILAGLAFLTHLNGTIYSFAGLALLLYQRDYKSAFLFSISTGLVSLCYFIDIFSANSGLPTWLYQFLHDPATQNAFGLWPKLLVFFTYPKMFFQPLEVLALSLVLLFVGYTQRKLIRTLPPKLSVYFLALTISFWLITKKNSGFYTLLFMPFMFILLYELYRLNPFRNRGLYVVLAAYFIIGLYGIVEIIYKNFSKPYLPEAYASLRTQIPAHAHGLVPLTFFFNDYARYDKLIAYESFLFQFNESERNKERLAAWAKAENLRFMLVDYKYDRADFVPDEKTTKLGDFRRTYTDGRFAVYRR